MKKIIIGTVAIIAVAILTIPLFVGKSKAQHTDTRIWFG